MNDEVKRYVTTCDCMSEAAWGDYVRHSDYDALRTQVAELRAENEEWSPTMQRLGDQNQALRDQLEAARGLLRVNQERLSTISAHSMTKPADWCATFKAEIRSGIEQITAFLTATPAPEVQCKACNDTACDPSHEELVPCPECAAQPAHVDDFHGDDTALVSSAKALLALDEKGALTGGGIGGHARTIIGAFIARMAEQGERQEAVATVGAVIDRKRKVFSIDILDAAELHPGTKLYTTPQPGPDVRWLVSVSTNILGKLQHPTASVNAMDMWKLEDALKPFVDNRQAQQEGEKG